MHPYCFSLRWCGIRLFYYTIFVANLEKFRFFHPRRMDPSSSSSSASASYVTLTPSVFAISDSIPYMLTITLLIPVARKFDDSVVTTFVR